MDAPASLTNGKVLLLSGPASFAAAYVRRSLDRLGIATVSTGPGAATHHEARDDWRSATVCVLVDLDISVVRAVAGRQPDLPVLVIADAPDEGLPASCRALRPPFASYQVVELLDQMAVDASQSRVPRLRWASVERDMPPIWDIQSDFGATGIPL